MGNNVINWVPIQHIMNLHTLYNVILRIAWNFLETRENFDPSILPYKFGLILMGMKQKVQKKVQKKNSKWPTQKNDVFQNRQFSKKKFENFMDPSLG